MFGSEKMFPFLWAPRIGTGSIVGANAVVTKKFPDYCVLAGVPARIVKRFDFESGAWKKD